jgi:hypothetical protein
MSPRSTLRALALVLAFVAPSASARAADEEEVRKLTADAERIGKVMESVRGLSWKGEVRKGIQSRDELRAFVLEEIEKELPDEKVRAQEKVYAKIGFLPKGIDLKKTLVDLYSEQIAAFYNPERKELFLIEKGGPEQNMIMAHELVHALQDQHFDLLPLQKSIVDNDDRALALTSLIEGDATVAMIAYTLREQGLPMDVKALPIDIGQMMKMQAQLGDLMGGKGQEMLKKAPKVLSQNMLFGYVDGAGFCHKLIKRKGGYDAVSEAFRDIPTSSEQILHPEKYFGKERDEPVEVVLPDLAPALGEGWKLLLKNVMGEYNTALLFEEKLAKSRAEAAGRGWGGDAWQALEGPGGAIVFAWYSTWDTEGDAQEFAETYRDFHAKRGDGSRLDIERRGVAVAIIDGAPSDDVLEKIGAALDRVATRTGYAPIGAVAAAAPGGAGEGGAPFGGLSRPEGWTEVAAGPDAEQPYAFRWRSPEGVLVSALETAAAHRTGAQAAQAAAKAIEASEGPEGGVKLDRRAWRGKPAGRLSWHSRGERHLAYYVVEGGRQHVLEVSGAPDAIRAAFRAFRDANPGVIPEDEGPARPGNKHDAPKKKEPTLF